LTPSWGLAPPLVALVSYLNHNTAAMMISAPQNQSHGYKINFVRNDRPKCTHCHAWREREREREAIYAIKIIQEMDFYI
jgi:hypothetical protein